MKCLIAKDGSNKGGKNKGKSKGGSSSGGCSSNDAVRTGSRVMFKWEKVTLLVFLLFLWVMRISSGSFAHLL